MIGVFVTFRYEDPDVVQGMTPNRSHRTLSPDRGADGPLASHDPPARPLEQISHYAMRSWAGACMTAILVFVIALVLAVLRLSSYLSFSAYSIL
jgi:hypothetical protein